MLLQISYDEWKMDNGQWRISENEWIMVNDEDVMRYGELEIIDG